MLAIDSYYAKRIKFKKHFYVRIFKRKKRGYIKQARWSNKKGMKVNLRSFMLKFLKSLHEKQIERIIKIPKRFKKPKINRVKVWVNFEFVLIWHSPDPHTETVYQSFQIITDKQNLEYSIKHNIMQRMNSIWIQKEADAYNLVDWNIVRMEEFTE